MNTGKIILSQPTPAWSYAVANYPVLNTLGQAIGPCFLRSITIKRAYSAIDVIRTDTITLLDGEGGVVRFRLNTGVADPANPLELELNTTIELPGEGIRFWNGPWVSSNMSTTHGTTPNLFILVYNQIIETPEWTNIEPSQSPNWVPVITS